MEHRVYPGNLGQFHSRTVVIDHQRRLLFVHIARTGGTSIETACAGQDWFRIEKTRKHLSASQMHVLYGNQIWRDYAKFTVVRNPWDRLVSMWTSRYWYGPKTNFQGVQPASFADFVRAVEPHPNEHYRTLHYHEILDEPLDFTLRFESLMTDFADMLSRLELAPLPLPHLEKKPRDHYRSFYDDALAEEVARRFARDIRDYDYSF